MMAIPVSTLGDATATRLMGRDVIVFDGECVLCSAFFRFILRNDPQARFSFATAQSDIGQACYTALGMSLREFESNLVIVNGQIFTDMDAFAAAMRTMGWPWRGLAISGWLPGPIKRPLYRLIARNRYRVFGRYDTCLVPDLSVQSRFLPGGWG